MLRRIVLRDPANAHWLAFNEPVDVLLALRPADVLPVIRATERRVRKEKLYAAGFVTYEAASGFDDALRTHPPSELPLVCFGLFEKPRVMTEPDRHDASGVNPAEWQMMESHEDYVDKIRRIKEQIELGNTYQINYTVRKQAHGPDNAWNLFRKAATDAPYAAYIDSDDFTIISASPELFFRLQDDLLTCKPMKGTARRGLTCAEDDALRETLQMSVKNRAENVMILDMVRNDMGRIATSGSVKVTDLFDVEKHPTVWQMTSTVAARTTAPVSDIFSALFPSASVTGAPKVSSMLIINELEDTPRQIYTGAIGFVGPAGQAQFNVAIRTALVDKTSNTAVYGVGGGIVWDSDPEDEFNECLAKARVLTKVRPADDVRLLETVLWTPDLGYVLMSEHLDRMWASADYFDFAMNRTVIERSLDELAAHFPAQRQRVRLVLQRDGRCAITHRPLSDDTGNETRRIRLAAEPISTDDVYLYHKTTQRAVYDDALRSVPAGYDVLLWNRDGFITETSIANVAVRIGGDLCTPPVECGLLNGTYRQWLLDSGLVREWPVHVDELAQGEELVLFNSVRGQYTGLYEQVAAIGDELSDVG